MPNEGSKVQAENETTRLDLPTRIMSSIEEDAGSELDAGREHPIESTRMLTQAAFGTCSLECDSALCVDPGAVCSQLDGFCRPGCDKTRPECGAGRACDFSSTKRLCFDLAGECESASDCPVFDDRLVEGKLGVRERGVVVCEEQRCRYKANPPDRVIALKTSVAHEGLRTVNVHAPLAGERILADKLSTFTFQFDLPAQLIVATILTREIKNLEDGAAAAVWTAYLDDSEALAGVTLAQGGSMVNGVWQPYSGSELPLDKQLYFLVLGYERGQQIATSELVPFSVGGARPNPGDFCFKKDGEFCSADSALVCADNVCRTPCLSQADCAEEGQGRSCNMPGVFSVRARLCM